ncbi:MAG: cobalt transporter CbiM [Leptolyngbya sp. SIO4C1]|nr:cobalt transporter CbiM [Leptolyngbya sp. SIO4C1]
MHIPDGFLPAPVCIAGYGATGLLTWYSLKRIQHQRDPSADIPKASLLAAAFFVASSISIPVPPMTVHLVLNGLLGAILGYYAFPAILVGLLFQSVFIGHGGLSTLGVDAAMMGLPALVAYHLFQLRSLLSQRLPLSWRVAIAGFVATAVGLGLSVLIFVGLIVTTVPPGLDAATERTAVAGLALAHLPLLVIEGLFTATVMVFLQRVKPEMIAAGQQFSRPNRSASERSAEASKHTV